jgi:GDPmannose 4,6-dehydratase
MKAFITGVTGQDGYYLSKHLIDSGYEVHGTVRRSSTFNTSRIDGLISKFGDTGQFTLYYSDVVFDMSLVSIIQKIQPDEIYNLGAQSHVAVSFETPEYTADTVGLGALRVLEAIRITGLEKKTRFYQASTRPYSSEVEA